MDLFKELLAAFKNPFSVKSFYVIFVNFFIIALIGIILSFFLTAFYA